jgi:hypothetical protein
MSSSRSIAAARNRRSGDSSSGSAQISRPNRSIGGQSSFTPPQQQTKRPGQPQQMMQQDKQGIVPVTKLSVSDAIGLITLRLGRLETFMYDVQAGAIGGTNELPENTQLVDKSVMTSIINRLESLEKREPTTSATSSSVTNTVFTGQIANLEKEVKDLKEILLNHIMKYEKFIINNEKTLANMEDSIQECNNYFTNATNETNVNLEIENVNDGSSEEDDNDNDNECLASNDLKQAIQKELANNSF